MRRIAGLGLVVADTQRTIDFYTKTLGLPDLVVRVLLARGVDDPDKARAFLRPDLSAMHDPFAFKDMQKAVDRIRHALRHQQTILIHGDYDVDGISGTVLLHKFFRLLHADVRPYIPARQDGYSFSAASERAVAASKAQLVISVDNGTNACDAISRIQETGTDVIVTTSDDGHTRMTRGKVTFELPSGQTPVNGYSHSATHGDRYVKGAYRSVVDIAKDIRADVKAAKETGWLPSNLTYRVQTRHGSTVDVDIEGLSDADRTDPDKVADAARGWNQRNTNRDEITELRHRVQSLIDRHKKFDSDSMTDYFGDNFYGSANVQTDDEARFWARWFLAGATSIGTAWSSSGLRSSGLRARMRSSSKAGAGTGTSLVRISELPSAEY